VAGSPEDLLSSGGRQGSGASRHIGRIVPRDD
jgi:hypothetical protein